VVPPCPNPGSASGRPPQLFGLSRRKIGVPLRLTHGVHHPDDIELAPRSFSLQTRGQARYKAAHMDCRCVAPPLNHLDFSRTDIGMDPAHGRFADVSIDRCKQCGSLWLAYQYELEALSRSGRWYRGLITPAQAEHVAATSALAILAALPWYLYGGGYYDSSGRRSNGPLDLTTV
jgi:hypothetical protein